MKLQPIKILFLAILAISICYISIKCPSKKSTFSSYDPDYFDKLGIEEEREQEYNELQEYRSWHLEEYGELPSPEKEEHIFDEHYIDPEIMGYRIWCVEMPNS